MPFISLSNSELQVEVSEEDHLYLLLFDWHLAGKGYARSNSMPYEYLHRAVANRMGLSPHLEVDHIDRNKLNSKRDNLRSATRSEQMINSAIQSNNTSGYKCISYEPRRDRWIIQIQRQGKRVYVGSCKTLEAAISMRDAYLKRNGLTFTH